MPRPNQPLKPAAAALQIWRSRLSLMAAELPMFIVVNQSSGFYESENQEKPIHDTPAQSFHTVLRTARSP
jgi:hypothetical protein